MIQSDASWTVVCTFGRATLIKDVNWNSAKRQDVKIAQVLNASKALDDKEHFMHDTLFQKSCVAADRLFDVGQEICLKLVRDHAAEYAELFKDLEEVDVSRQTTVKCIGRVCSDSNSALTATSTLLVGADDMRLRTVKLNFNRLKSFSLFPGQTIFARGLNPRGEMLFVDEILAERDLKYSEAPLLSENLSVVVVSGPFTHPDALNYERINDIISYCKQHKPNVLILVGPFLDVSHKSVATMESTFEVFFENLMMKIMDAVGSEVNVLVISSSRDAHGTTIYPTHPYSLRSNYKNLRFLPDPCTVQINGVTVGISSTDIFSHILDAELSENAGDKIKRVANYLFHQSSFYPMSPASNQVSLDVGLAQKYASLDVVPNILIISSALKPFVREIERCLVINPGQSMENTSGGTFGRIFLTSSTNQQNLKDFIACQIVKF